MNEPFVGEKAAQKVLAHFTGGAGEKEKGLHGNPARAAPKVTRSQFRIGYKPDTEHGFEFVAISSAPGSVAWGSLELLHASAPAEKRFRIVTNRPGTLKSNLWG